MSPCHPPQADRSSSCDAHPHEWRPANILALRCQIGVFYPFLFTRCWRPLLPWDGDFDHRDLFLHPAPHRSVWPQTGCIFSHPDNTSVHGDCPLMLEVCLDGCFRPGKASHSQTMGWRSDEMLIESGLPNLQNSMILWESFEKTLKLLRNMQLSLPAVEMFPPYHTAEIEATAACCLTLRKLVEVGKPEVATEATMAVWSGSCDHQAHEARCSSSASP